MDMRLETIGILSQGLIIAFFLGRGEILNDFGVFEGIKKSDYLLRDIDRKLQYAMMGA